MKAIGIGAIKGEGQENLKMIVLGTEVDILKSDLQISYTSWGPLAPERRVQNPMSETRSIPWWGSW